MTSQAERYDIRLSEHEIAWRVYDREYGVYFQRIFQTTDEAREFIDAQVDATAQMADVAAREADDPQYRHYYDD